MEETNGIDKAREMVEAIKSENRNTSTGVVVEDSKTVAKVEKNLDIVGLEEVPVSMVPVPFYKLVQPGSTNTTLADGTDAVPGTILMGDSGKTVDSLRFALLRAKRLHRTFTNNEGEVVNSTSMGVLGFNLETMLPFVINLSVASFSGFGQMVKQMKDKKVAKAWEYPVTLTTEKREEVKETSRGTQKVKYWVVNMAVGDTRLDDDTITIIDCAYQEFAAALDRNNEEPKAEPMPFG